MILPAVEREALRRRRQRETVMGPLRTREDGRRCCWRRQSLLQCYVHSLAMQQLHTGPPLLSAAPVLPEHRGRAHREWMQQQTDPTRLCRLLSVPLTLGAQGADTTVSDPGGVEYSQRAIVLGALLSRVQRLVCRTPQCPVGLEGKVLSRRSGQLSRRWQWWVGHNQRREQASRQSVP